MSTELTHKVFVDLLCLHSLAKLIPIARKKKSLKVYYCQASAKSFLLLKYFRWAFAHVYFEQLDTVSLSRLKIEGCSGYIYVHQQMNQILSRIREDALKVIQKSDFVEEDFGRRLKWHFHDVAMNSLYRSVELLSLAKGLEKNKSVDFLFCRRPINLYLKHIFPKEGIHLYSGLFLSPKFIKARKEYVYDSVIVHDFCTSNFFLAIKQLLKKIRLFFHLIAFRGMIRSSKDKDSNGSEIIVEQWQSRYRKNEINDLFWVPFWKRDKRKISYLITEDLDEKSLADLSTLGIKKTTIKLRRLLKFRKELDAIFPNLPISYLLKDILFSIGNLLHAPSNQRR